MRRRMTAGVGVLAISMLTAACGSSSSSTTSTNQAAATAGGAHARAVVSRLSKPQDPVAVASLPKAPTRGLAIDIQTCELPVCEATTDAAAQAAKALGWKVDYLKVAATPQAYVQAWNQMLQNPPKMIAFTGIFPDAIITKQLAEARRLKIKMVDMAPANGQAPAGVAAAIQGAAAFHEDGTLMADIVAADAGSSAKVGWVTDPTLQTLVAPILASLRSELKATCGCSVSVINESVNAPQAQNQARTVNFIKRNPDVKYLTFSNQSLIVGLPQALKAQGLGDVKLVDRTPQSIDLQYLMRGEELGAVFSENSAAGWRAIDGLARLSEGITPAPNAAGFHSIFTKANVRTTVVPQVPGVPEDYLEAWHVS